MNSRKLNDKNFARAEEILSSWPEWKKSYQITRYKAGSPVKDDVISGRDDPNGYKKGCSSRSRRF